MMKLLLTSGGVTNPTIRAALVDLLGKPIAECHALCIPTAQWGHPMCGPASARGFIVGEPPWHHMGGLGWASLGLLELTALPTIGAERWIPWVREADVLLVDGGDATYLNTGTWANVMRFPRELFAADDDTAGRALVSFVERVRQNDLDGMIVFRPTYVRLDLGAVGGVGRSDEDGLDVRPR